MTGTGFDKFATAEKVASLKRKLKRRKSAIARLNKEKPVLEEQRTPPIIRWPRASSGMSETDSMSVEESGAEKRLKEGQNEIMKALESMRESMTKMVKKDDFAKEVELLEGRLDKKLETRLDEAREGMRDMVRKEMDVRRGWASESGSSNMLSDNEESPNTMGRRSGVAPSAKRLRRSGASASTPSKSFSSRWQPLQAATLMSSEDEVYSRKTLKMKPVKHTVKETSAQLCHRAKEFMKSNLQLSQEDVDSLGMLKCKRPLTAREDKESVPILVTFQTEDDAVSIIRLVNRLPREYQPEDPRRPRIYSKWPAGWNDLVKRREAQARKIREQEKLFVNLRYADAGDDARIVLYLKCKELNTGWLREDEFREKYPPEDPRMLNRHASGANKTPITNKD